MIETTPIAIDLQSDQAWPLAQFDLERAHLVGLDFPNQAPDALADLALAILEAAALVGAIAWERLIASDDLSVLESFLVEPGDMLAGFEQQLFAPVEMGLRERALVMIEALGHRDPGAAREVERLLHAAGESTAAYRVERGRRAVRLPTPPSPDDAAPSTHLIVAVAGGHPRLRKMIRRDLARAGVADLHEIPSAFEASRGGRDVAAKLAGVDLVVVIVRQIAHSTSDQVTSAAAKLKVPVAFSHSAGIAGVRREVDAFAATRRG